MTFMKVTGGALRVRSLMKYTDRDGNAFEEKISQLRIYSGAKYDTAEAVCPGQICAALGLTGTYRGRARHGGRLCRAPAGAGDELPRHSPAAE